MFRPRVFELPSKPGVDGLIDALAVRPGLAVLDSAGGAPRRFSLVAFDPIRAGAELPDDVRGLRAFVGLLARVPGDDVPGPFHGGFLGAFSYDLGPAGEGLRLPSDAWHSPRVVGGLYTDFFVLDHERDRAWLVLGEDPGDGRPPVDERRGALLDRLAAPPRAAPAPRPRGPLVRHVAGAEHRARIERAREWIAQGELYQVNVAHRFSRRMDGHPTAIYRRLRSINPAPYMAYLAFGDERGVPSGALLSASPELLFELDGRRARTRPIKGTIERGLTPAADAAQRAALLASVKDRAELAMIVDLERNDLGRVARPGSVRVAEFPALETYAALHHLVAEVSCELRDGLDAVDVLGNLFPGGSVTGAPKLRAMEAIAELEREGRGFFTGSLGFLDTRGRAAFNILIRTLVWRNRPGTDPDVTSGEVTFHVGGGITWSSDAAAEERETLVKGAALAAALSDVDGAPDTLGIALPRLQPAPAVEKGL